MAQSSPANEVIVVDDGADDATAALVSGFGHPVHYFRQPGSRLHSGPAAVRNTGLGIAAGVYIGFLDDDDLWPVDKLESQLKYLRENAACEVVLGYTQRMLQRTTADEHAYFENYREPLHLFHLGCALFRRSVFEKVGIFNAKMRFAEDDDWFMRAREMDIDMQFQPGVSFYYRFHQTNMTRDIEAKRAHLLHLLKYRLDRKRQ